MDHSEYSADFEIRNEMCTATVANHMQFWLAILDYGWTLIIL